MTTGSVVAPGSPPPIAGSKYHAITWRVPAHRLLARMSGEALLDLWLNLQSSAPRVLRKTLAWQLITRGYVKCE